MQKSIRTSGLAYLTGVTPQTIRKWVKDGKIPFHTSPSGQLFFTPEDQEQILGELPEREKIWVYYIRSSSGRKSSFENQEKLLRGEYPEPVKILKDAASGLNENRRNLKKLISMVQNGEVTDVAVTMEDRLSRFGVSYLKSIFIQNSVTLHVLSEKEEETPEQELVDDFMALIASFSGRFYKLRSKENSKKLLDIAQRELSNE